MTHPTWCLGRDRCAFRGAHLGRLVIINSRTGDFAPVTIQLGQSTVRHAEPFVIVSGEAARVVLSIGQARAMAYSVKRLAEVAAEGDRS